ncbi:uncharacterized protein [Amphiura filiformis]|uniref:uncharacterized protein isoform X4 n=1 Tax=Amphiura filiformis TaxID=82378 RepID=UPI003B20E4B8
MSRSSRRMSSEYRKSFDGSDKEVARVKFADVEIQSFDGSDKEVPRVRFADDERQSFDGSDKEVARVTFADEERQSLTGSDKDVARIEDDERQSLNGSEKETAKAEDDQIQSLSESDKKAVRVEDNKRQSLNGSEEAAKAEDDKIQSLNGSDKEATKVEDNKRQSLNESDKEAAKVEDDKRQSLNGLDKEAAKADDSKRQSLNESDQEAAAKIEDDKRQSYIQSFDGSDTELVKVEDDRRVKRQSFGSDKEVAHVQWVEDDETQVTVLMEHPTYPSPSDEVFDPVVDVGTSRDSRLRYHRRRSTFGVSRETAMKAKRRMPYLILLLLILSLVGVVVGLSVTLTSNHEDEDKSNFVKIRGKLRIANRSYTPKFRDPGSTQYKEFTNEFINRIDTIYKKSDFNDMYVHTVVTDLKPGSLLVMFEVALLPHRTSRYSIDDHTHNRIYNFMVRHIEKGLGVYEIPEFLLSIDALILESPTTQAPHHNATVSDEATTYTYIHNNTTSESGKLLERKASCNPNPCENNGQCTINEGYTNGETPEVRCFCAAGFGGDLCQNLLPSKCESMPCRHDGVCRGDYKEYTCECTPFYYGVNCDYKYLNPCRSSPCLNGATCYGFADRYISKFSCMCPPNFGGRTCEIENPEDTFSELPPDYGSSETHLTCQEVQTTACQDIISQNLTIIPNPFGFGDTGEEVIQAYTSFEPLITASCHVDSHLVLCSLLNPECPDIFSQEMPVISLFEYDLPCRSLCLEVGAACFSGIAEGDSTVTHLVSFWEEMCDNLPESAETSICFLSTEKTDEVTAPSSCTPSPCLNGGTCFELSGETQCRCPYGFGGLICDTIIPDPCDKDPCLNGGTCVSNLHYGMSYHWCQCPETEDSHVYYGINCELPQEDESLLMHNGMTCTSQFLPPECKNILPYNTTSASSIVPPTWTTIEPWTHCHPQAALFLCSIIAPQCTKDWPLIEPCMDFCQLVDPHCSFNYAALGLHKFSCGSLPRSTDRNSRCFKIT